MGCFRTGGGDCGRPRASPQAKLSETNPFVLVVLATRSRQIVGATSSVATRVWPLETKSSPCEEDSGVGLRKNRSAGPAARSQIGWPS